jgi:DNA-binding NarL/FixJ family response regulator
VNKTNQRSPQTYRIFIVEDHLILRKTLLKLLEREPGLAIAGEAGSASEALAHVFEVKPDLILVDISLPGTNGITLVEEMRKKQPDLRCLIVSGHEESVYIREALKAGARGYVMKGDPNAILSAIRHVMNGEIYLSEAMQRQLGM